MLRSGTGGTACGCCTNQDQPWWGSPRMVSLGSEVGWSTVVRKLTCLPAAPRWLCKAAQPMPAALASCRETYTSCSWRGGWLPLMWWWWTLPAQASRPQ